MGQVFTSIHTETSHYFPLAKIESNQIHSCKKNPGSSYLVFSVWKPVLLAEKPVERIAAM